MRCPLSLSLSLSLSRSRFESVDTVVSRIITHSMEITHRADDCRGRRGLVTPNLPFPTSLIHTYRCAVPYVPPDVLPHMAEAPAFPLGLHLGDAVGVLPPQTSEGLAAFAGTEHPLVGLLTGPGSYVMEGKRSKKSVSVAGAEGRISLDVQTYVETLAATQLDLAELLADVPKPRAGSRRIQKAAANSLAMWDALKSHPGKEIGQARGPLFLVRLLGGEDPEEITKGLAPVAEMMGTEMLGGVVGGVILPDLRALRGKGEVDADALWETILDALPDETVKLNAGAVTPAEILEAVRDGKGDLFYDTFPSQAAGGGYALVLSLEGGLRRSVNVRDVSFALEKGPLVPGCTCYACQNHSRGYIHHLITVQEMLGIELITLHNQSVFQTFLADIRTALAAAGEGGQPFADVVDAFLQASSP